MTDHVYKTVEITGSSTDDMTMAIQNAVAKASDTLHGLDWFQVTDIRGDIANGAIQHYQVTVKIGFRLD